MKFQIEESPDTCYFATLTYDDEHLPLKKVWNDDPEGGPYINVPTLRKSDLQSFNADMRKRFQQGFFLDHTLSDAGFAEDPARIDLPDCHFKYYCTGEYGPNGHRPHMHGVYFGMPEDESLVLDLMHSVWHRGFVMVEKARSEKAAAYTAKYLVNDSLVPHHPYADRPFSLMSKGLGLGYLTESMEEWHRADPLGRCYVPLRNGRRSVLPRYFRDRLFDDAMKADILEDKLSRDEHIFARESRLSADELSRREASRRHKEAEAIRQAEWRFKKSGKIK